VSFWHPSRLVTKLSQVEIDVNKDWRQYIIKNLGAPVDSYDSLRKAELDSHKTASVLDHPDSSVTLEKLVKGVSIKDIMRWKGPWWYCNNWAPANFIDAGVGGSGSIGWSTWYLQLSTGTTSASWARVIKAAPRGFWGVGRYFYALVFISTYSDEYMHIGSGYVPAGSADNTYDHIGYKLIGSTLYGTVGSGTAESTLTIETITDSVWRELECILDPSAGKVYFYVDGTYKGSITTNLPDPYGTYRFYLFAASIYNTAAADKRVQIYEARIVQEE
jgi:hypothetical protein